MSDRIYEIEIQWDPEDPPGCFLVLRTETDEIVFGVTDPEQFHRETVKEIGGWVAEMEDAQKEFVRASFTERVVAVREDGSLRVEPDEDAYDPSDPKHPHWHSVHADHYDNREGK